MAMVEYEIIKKGINVLKVANLAAEDMVQPTTKKSWSKLFVNTQEIENLSPDSQNTDLEELTSWRLSTRRRLRP